MPVLAVRLVGVAFMVKKEHGGDIYTERGIPDGVELVDFSANLNPLGMPQAVKDALCQDPDAYQSYPDPPVPDIAPGDWRGIRRSGKLGCMRKRCGGYYLADGAEPKAETRCFARANFFRICRGAGMCGL